MQVYKYVIVGGGIAGTTAAETIRKIDGEGKIAIISDEPHPLYSRVLLSKPAWVTGDQPFDNVWIKKDTWYTENSIHLFKGIAATALDADRRQLTLSDGDVLTYEKLLLATGAHSRPWAVPGAEKSGVLYLRTVDDAKRVGEMVQGTPGRVVMIGSSCVSFEIIEILLSKGFTVTEVMRESHFFEPSLSREEAALIEQVLEEKGVEIIRETEVAEVLGEGQVSGVRLASGVEVACEHILAFIGVELPVGWIQAAGIATHRGIYANEYLETNVPDVWTAGDTAEGWDRALGETVIMGNWMSARLQGEVAGRNMTGMRVPYEQVSFHSSHGFGHTIGWTGDVRIRPDRTVLVYPLSGTAYCRMVVLNGRLMGGTTVDRPDLMGTLTALIKKRVDLTPHMDAIRTGTIDLKTLLSS